MPAVRVGRSENHNVNILCTGVRNGEYIAGDKDAVRGTIMQIFFTGDTKMYKPSDFAVNAIPDDDYTNRFNFDFFDKMPPVARKVYVNVNKRHGSGKSDESLLISGLEIILVSVGGANIICPDKPDNYDIT